jgi:hypothetical protein
MLLLRRRASGKSELATPGNAGLFQIVVQIPLTLADRDYPVVAAIWQNAIAVDRADRC